MGANGEVIIWNVSKFSSALSNFGTVLFIFELAFLVSTVKVLVSVKRFQFLGWIPTLMYE